MRRRWPDRDEDDRKQFLAAAQTKAVRNYRKSHGDYAAYIARAAKHARIDWDRMAKVERRKKARTKSLASLHSELETPSFLDNLTVTDELDSILKQIDALWQRALRLRYLEGHSITSLAQKLRRTPRNTRSLVEKAIKEAKRVSRR